MNQNISPYPSLSSFDKLRMTALKHGMKTVMISSELVELSNHLPLVRLRRRGQEGFYK